MKRILFSGILIGLFITIGSIIAILYATGYRFEFKGNGTGNFKFIEGTGLLVATSKPDGARVYVNNDLTTATNNTINLAPGEYDVRIEKDGYLPWSKKISINNSLVSEANALLFPTAPKLEAITTIGVSNVKMDKGGTRLAYSVASASAAKNGIYVLNMNSGPLVFLGASGTQIVDDSIAPFSQAETTFSPDGKEILAYFPLTGVYYLLKSDQANQTPLNITSTLALTQKDWEEQQKELDKKLSDSLPKKLRPVASTYFKNMLPSPEGDRILYTASTSATLPLVLSKKVPSVNSTPENRNLKKDSIYVYDIKEDKNYKIFDFSSLKEGEETNKYLWHADNRHLINAKNGKINILEFDGGNPTTVYNGQILDELFFPWPDGSSVGLVFRLSESVPYNIYRIGLQ